MAKNQLSLLEKKEAALMAMVYKIRARYLAVHVAALDNEIFRLFEKAKGLHHAETNEAFQLILEKDL